jgi:hypothetical protein
MDDFQTQALFGNTDNTSYMPPGSWNPSAQDSTDIGHILAAGIAGTVDKAIRTAVGEKYASGQLTPTAQVTTSKAQANLMPLLIVGALVLLLVKA